MFNEEQGIALCTMQGNQASSHGEEEFSWFFLELQWERGVYSQVTMGMALQELCLISDVRTPV